MVVFLTAFSIRFSVFSAFSSKPQKVKKQALLQVSIGGAKLDQVVLLSAQRLTDATLRLELQVNHFKTKLILVHTTVTGTYRRVYKTCKNWPLCSYVG